MKLFKFDRYEMIAAPLALFIVGPVAWMALDKSPAMVITDATAPLAPVPRGGALKPRYIGAYLRRCSGTSRRVFVDASGKATWIEPYDFRDGIDADGKPVTLDREQVLPPTIAPVPDLLPGKASYQSVIHFYCNPLQRAVGRAWPWLSISYALPKVEFVVANSEAPVVAPSKPLFAPVQDDVQPAPPADGAPR